MRMRFVGRNRMERAPLGPAAARLRLERRPDARNTCGRLAACCRLERCRFMLIGSWLRWSTEGCDAIYQLLCDRREGSFLFEIRGRPTFQPDSK